MKIFPKLILTTSALLVGTTVGLSSAFYVSERRSLEQDADQERRAVLHHLVHIAEECFLTNDDLLLIKYSGWLHQGYPALRSASVVNRQGEVIAHSAPERIGTLAQKTSGDSADALVLSQPVHLGNRWVATASVAFSRQYVRALMRQRLVQLQQRVGEVAGLAMLAALLICLALAHSWKRSIARLAEAAKRIGRGEYHLSLAALDRRGDEVGLLARAFGQMAHQLFELDQMKEDFVSAVTHELRSPLGAIESYLNLIEHESRTGTGPEAWALYLERLRMNTQRLTRFVNDLLDVAAIERGKVVFEPRPLAITPLLQEVIALYQPKLSAKRLTVGVDVPDAEPRVLADREKLRQILINLIGNAIKFTPEGGRLDISLEPRAAAERVRVCVRDTGIGIAHKDQVKLFSKFEQVRSARPAIEGPKGTGLGLSICKALVELHGGRLGLTSRPGEGSIFYFTLPAAKSAQGGSS
jgi:signal transduction histidine kinase